MGPYNTRRDNVRAPGSWATHSLCKLVGAVDGRSSSCYVHARSTLPCQVWVILWNHPSLPRGTKGTKHGIYTSKSLPPAEILQIVNQGESVWGPSWAQPGGHLSVWDWEAGGKSNLIFKGKVASPAGTLTPRTISVALVGSAHSMPSLLRCHI
jgi:hypothetical protein